MRLMTLTHCQLSKSRKKSNAIFIHVKNVRVNTWLYGNVSSDRKKSNAIFIHVKNARVNTWLWQCLERPRENPRNRSNHDSRLALS